MKIDLPTTRELLRKTPLWQERAGEWKRTIVDCDQCGTEGVSGTIRYEFEGLRWQSPNKTAEEVCDDCRSEAKMENGDDISGQGANPST